MFVEVSIVGLGGTVSGGRFWRDVRIRLVISCASISMGGGSLRSSSVSVVLLLMSDILVFVFFGVGTVEVMLVLVGCQ